jgi:hypothetical protein
VSSFANRKKLFNSRNSVCGLPTPGASLSTDEVFTWVSLGEDFKEVLVAEVHQEGYGILL